MEEKSASGETPEPLVLLDAASPSEPDLLSELEEQRSIAGDPSLPVETRLEAFADIFDSQVGDTSLVRARNIEQDYRLRQLYLKFEGGNPSGTQKDRIAFAQVEDALRRGFDRVTLASCGNYGAAMAIAAAVGGLECEVLIPEGYSSKRLAEIERSGARVLRLGHSYEEAVEISKERASEHEFYDANAGGKNTSLQLNAYGEIAREIYDELRDAPAAVAVPVSNGSTLAGIYRGFVRLYRRGKTSRIPRMIGGSSPHKNPIVRAFLKNLPHCEDLDPARLTESEVNEPLISWHAYDGEEALRALRESQGVAAHTSDKMLRAVARLVRDREGLSAMPASVAGLAAMLEHHQGSPLPGDRYVAVLTGRKT